MSAREVRRSVMRRPVIGSHDVESFLLLPPFDAAAGVAALG